MLLTFIICIIFTIVNMIPFFNFSNFSVPQWMRYGLNLHAWSKTWFFVEKSKLTHPNWLWKNRTWNYEEPKLAHSHQHHQPPKIQLMNTICWESSAWWHLISKCKYFISVWHLSPYKILEVQILQWYKSTFKIS